MPTQRYERVPLEEQNLPPDRHYFTGIPSTAPPSFHTTPSTTHLPHRNDETAATIMPRSERPTTNERIISDIQELVEPAMSVWASSEADIEHEMSADDRRDDLIVKLMDRVEQLEMRMQDKNTEKDIEAQNSPKKSNNSDICIAILAWIGFAIFCVWFMATITLSIWIGHDRKSKAA